MKQLANVTKKNENAVNLYVGYLFEYFSYYILKFHPYYKNNFDNIYINDLVPISILDKLDLPIDDMGFDLLAIKRGSIDGNLDRCNENQVCNQRYNYLCKRGRENWKKIVLF